MPSPHEALQGPSLPLLQPLGPPPHSSTSLSSFPPQDICPCWSLCLAFPSHSYLPPPCHCLTLLFNLLHSTEHHLKESCSFVYLVRISPEM